MPKKKKDVDEIKKLSRIDETDKLDDTPACTVVLDLCEKYNELVDKYNIMHEQLEVATRLITDNNIFSD